MNEKNRQTILIVDDDESVLNALQVALEGADYNPLTAISGEAALDILSSEDVDLIILDIYMPEIDGKQIFTAVKEIEPEVPIIIITGMAVEDGQAFADAHGAEGFIKKPFEPAVLIKKIQELIETA